MPGVFVSILIVLCILGFLIFIHELGHFLSAKYFHVRVDAFAIGMGPKVFSKTIGETEYRINLLPLGGYVKIMGEGDEVLKGKDIVDPRNFKNKPKWQKIIILLAGVTMNFLFAVIVYYFFIISSNFQWIVGDEMKDFKPVKGDVRITKMGDVKYSGVTDTGNANKAGFPESGKIQRIDDFTPIYSNQVSEYLSGKKGRVVKMVLCDDKCSEYSVKVSSEGKIGIYINPNYFYYIDYSDVKVGSGFYHSLNLVKLVGTKLSSISQEAKETGDYTPLVDNISGPVGVYLVVDAFKEYGFTTLLGMTADFSLMLMLMNVLPIPALDGGRVLLIVIEAIMRKPLNKKLEAFIINASFLFLMLFMIAIMFKDVIFFDRLRELLK